MPNLIYFQQELSLLKVQKKQAEEKLAEYKGKGTDYHYGYWWGTLCQINSQISNIQATVDGMTKSAVAGRS